MDGNRLLNLALEAGELMLTAGAETHRVEDTMERILSVGKDARPEAVALSSLLLVSIHTPISGSLTQMRKVSKRVTDFEIICRVNALSRRFVAGHLSIEEAGQILKEIRTVRGFPPVLVLLAYGVASSGFTVTFSGTARNAACAFIAGILMGLVIQLLAKQRVSIFLYSLFGGFCAALFSVLLFVLGLNTEYHLGITGAIMPLLPGVIITNGIRDFMEGNFLSGTSKLIEAILVAVAVAGGVGLMLTLYHALL